MANASESSDRERLKAVRGSLGEVHEALREAVNRLALIAGEPALVDTKDDEIIGETVLRPQRPSLASAVGAAVEARGMLEAAVKSRDEVLGSPPDARNAAGR